MRLDLAATCDAASKGQAAPVKVGRLFVATLRRNASAPRQRRDVCGTAADCTQCSQMPPYVGGGHPHCGEMPSGGSFDPTSTRFHPTLKSTRRQDQPSLQTANRRSVRLMQTHAGTVQNGPWRP